MADPDAPVLLTNDDGLHAPGLYWLAHEMDLRFPGRVHVVAPASERSATGHGITLREEVVARPAELAGLPRVKAHAVAGTPVDCVKLAVRALLRSTPALVCSGVNRGYNLGTAVLYSGTVSAALEAAMLGLPALAVSTGPQARSDGHRAAKLAAELAARIEARGLPDHTMLNLNVPESADGERTAREGYEVTRLGFHSHADQFSMTRLASGETSYRLAMEPAWGGDEQGTDAWAVGQGLISLTPLHFDLTNGAVIDFLATWLR